MNLYIGVFTKYSKSLLQRCLNIDINASFYPYLYTHMCPTLVCAITLNPVWFELSFWVKETVVGGLNNVVDNAHALLQSEFKSGSGHVAE